MTSRGDDGRSKRGGGGSRDRYYRPRDHSQDRRSARDRKPRGRSSPPDNTRRDDHRKRSPEPRCSDRKYRGGSLNSESPERRHRDRGGVGRRRKNSDDFPDFGGGGGRRNKRRKRNHSRSGERRGRDHRSFSRRRGEGEERSPPFWDFDERNPMAEDYHRRQQQQQADDDYYRRGGRRRGRSADHHHSSSPEARPGGRRRGRRGRHRGRRRGGAGGRRSGSISSNSPGRPPPVAADVAPRAGVVSDDDDGGGGHGGGHTTAAASRTNDKAQQSKPAVASAAGKKRSKSASSSRDDTIGHFKGREGGVIADRYRIIREVGVGTFGRVVECLDLKRARSRRARQDDKKVAIKVVRNVKRYYDSALIEADIVEDVNRRGGRGVTHCAVMFDAFTFASHYCMVFESLGPSLYDFLKRQKYQPFPIACVRDFARQLLETLEFLHSFRLIHTDLKPENILLLNGREVSYKGYNIPECTRIKVIDFGGATYDNEKKSSVVNTRQYRAPEVILGVGWSMPSDLWSVGKKQFRARVYLFDSLDKSYPLPFLMITCTLSGCILAELYQGELLFATHDNVEHLALIEQAIGPFPRRMLKKAKNTQLVTQAFDSMGAHRMERALSPESLAYVKRIGPLEQLVYDDDTWFLRLLRRILVTDPEERATARECLRKF